MEADAICEKNIDEPRLWRMLRESNDAEARFKLVDYYSSVARKIAATLYSKRLANDVEFQDYYQYALLGLMESIDRYDPNSDVLFETFATYRIKGSIIDGVRSFSEQREQSAYNLRIRKERLNSVAETAFSTDKNDLFKQIVDVAVGLAIGYMLEGSGLIQDPEASEGDTVYDTSVVRQLSERLLQLVDVLPDREKYIITNHYFYRMDFDLLASVLKMTKGRVSQIHKKGLQMLRVQFDKDADLDEYY